MSASAVKYCRYCLYHHPAEAFAKSSSTADKLQPICRAGHAEMYKDRYRKYTDGKRHYTCRCGTECAVDPRNYKAYLCPGCQKDATRARQAECDHNRVLRRRGELIAEPSEGRQKECKYCEHFLFCCAIAMTGAALPCAPKSAIVDHRGDLVRLGDKSNWKIQNA